MAIKQQSPVVLEETGLRLADAWEEFFLYQRSNRHSERTIEYYEYTLGKLRKWLESDGLEFVEQVQSPILRRFSVQLVESGLADNTVHNHMRAVRAFFRFLHKEGLLIQNPMANVKMPRVEKKILPAYTDEEVQKLLKASDDGELTGMRNRLLLRVLLESGLRLFECTALKRDSIDLQTGVMRVMGKGRKERVTRISTETLRLLRKYLRAIGSDTSNALWIGKRGAMTSCGLAETIEKIGVRAGVHAHPHKFRRTCAIRLLRNGADVFSVQLLLGHSDIAVLRRYLAQSEEDVLGVHERCTL